MSRPAIHLATFALAAVVSAAASATPASPDWRAHAPYRFTLVETRTATPATDKLPLTIRADVGWDIEPQADGSVLLRWRTSMPEVTPDAAPVKRNIPQLRDSILFAPGLVVDLRLDAAGRYFGVANVDQVGAAMRRAFVGDKPVEPRMEPFFAKITSPDAIAQGVMRVQALILNALAADWSTPGSRTEPVVLPGSTEPAGTLTQTRRLEAGKLLRRWELKLARPGDAVAQSSAADLLPPSAAQAMSDMVDAVEITSDARTGRLCRVVYSSAMNAGDAPFRMEYALANVVSCDAVAAVGD